jgi:hypothetical protein
MGCEGFLVYAVGFITPYLEADLGAAPWLAALPNSAMAAGLIVGGLIAQRLARRMGPRAAIQAWAAVMAAAAILLATPISIVVVLLGAALFGLSMGGALVHVNSALGAGARGGIQLVRAHLVAMLGGLVAPLAMAAAAHSVGWSVGALIPAPILVLLAATLPGSPARDGGQAAAGRHSSGLSRDYWLCWSFLTLTIAVEFSFVAWGSQVASLGTSLDTADATALAALYVVGMVFGRFILAVNPSLTARRLLILRAGTALVIVGAVILARAGSAPIAGLGLLLGGLGLSPAYPLAASLALAHAKGSPVAASARLTAASGVAIISAPLALGIVASGHGTQSAWVIVIVLLAVALVVALFVPRPDEPEPALPATP